MFWRVEMWCRKQAAAAILPVLLAGWLTSESSEALTTFGKSQTQAPKDAAPTAPPGNAWLTYYLTHSSLRDASGIKGLWATVIALILYINIFYAIE